MTDREYDFLEQINPTDPIEPPDYDNDSDLAVLLMDDPEDNEPDYDDFEEDDDGRNN